MGLHARRHGDGCGASARTRQQADGCSQSARLRQQADECSGSAANLLTGSEMDETSNELPLAGITLVELHAIGPVPFAGQLMRSLGARVLRVSPPRDPGLGVGIRREHDLLNAGKEERLLDLK